MKEALMGIYTLWLRDVIRFLRDKPRIVSSAAQPLLWLFVLGLGLSTAFVRGGSSQYLRFIYPGIISMSVLFTSIFSAVSIIWDREFGFLKEVLVAPIPRWSVAVGRALGGSTVAVMQGTIILLVAPLIGVKFGLVQLFFAFIIMFMIAFSMTSFGILIATRMRTHEGFQVVVNFLLLPMFFLSGAMFPTGKGLPVWMQVLVRIDPLSYGVDALRQTLVGLKVFPIWLDLGIVFCFGTVALALGVWYFERTE
ncbi:MAG: ABC transporter [Candidatus Aquicultor secundus]|uniref:Transport permease protein n=1 Tax=Candidatus Aquicultor secundus TaxID=1973895 RepID=A0A2M7T707_9ACTN|nr:ABC transporter permease [Candidatus Aquicultor secundus]NCO65828.1 ABC transporter permease [Solirubrobacter sp.]OIO88240.1 MAG: ABC transporter [Candidatus Aquicultor secundus]PIU27866.1 MAG: ABC transporter [Candidatus Aquicultor secundus]PIW21956.1 MAG: ABC transporter [Candidatus Aquicultor secundus]PIX53062.1 MAG: ABC transporter [Candidatus Aquicultor secundus]